MRADQIVEYRVRPQGRILQKYADCRDPVSIIIGPLGSGKTAQTILKFLDLMVEQEPNKRNLSKMQYIRPTRLLAVRNTYSDLFTTTIKDWMEIHGDLGPFKQGSKEPPKQDITFHLDDGTRVKSEIIFIAFDRPDHVKKARGLQVTWIWLNEVKELDKAVVDMLDMRHGRYPTLAKEGVACTQHGMVGDSNAPDQDHWLYRLAEEQRPRGWTFFKQPGGVKRENDRWVFNPKAENVRNLPGGPEYYLRGMEGKSDDWISVNLANEYGFVSDGKPVHPWYVDSVHCMQSGYEPVKARNIVLGFDFGRTPACIFCQQVEQMRWIAFDEFLAKDMGAVAFAPELKKYISANYQGFSFVGWGDPAGASKGQASDDTPIKILRANGIPCNATRTNDPTIRRASLENPMKEMCMDGKPRFMITPKCVQTRKGLQGGFKYRRIMVSGERYSDEPDKNEYSHPVEALEYALLGGGEGTAALKRPGNTTFSMPLRAPKSFDVFS